MNFFKHHIGDYAAATSHLSFVEDAAYSRLLRIYYRDERALPADVQSVQRLVGARSREEKRAVEVVLSEFFHSERDGHHNKRADEEIARAQVQSDANRLIAEAREERKRATNLARTEHESLNESLNDSLPSREPSHKPLATSQTPDKSKSTPVAPGGGLVPVVLTAYHDALPRCQRCETLTPKREKRIKFADKLARQLCERQGWDYDASQFWGAYFGECQNDPWLRGDVPNPKSSTWKQNLDVLLAEDRFAGIMDSAISAMGANA